MSLGDVLSVSFGQPPLCTVCDQSVLSLHFERPNHLNLPFSIAKLTGSNLNNSLSFAFYFLSFKVNRHIHLITLNSVLSNIISCSTFIGQVSLPYIRHLLTHDVQNLPFDFNTNSFAVSIGDYTIVSNCIIHSNNQF